MNKKVLLALFASTFLYMQNATAAHIVAEFAFDGYMSMISSSGDAMVLPPEQSIDEERIKHPVQGTMMLDFFTFGGTASMFGPEPFLFNEWEVSGPMSAHVDPLGAIGLNKPICAGQIMCADASLTFLWGSNSIPIDAAFSMTPVIDPFTFNLSKIEVGYFFDVASIDTDGDGILGTAITDGGGFTGFTPSFFGQARVTKINFFGDAIANQNLLFDRITPSTNAVPVPAAVWLFGSGLLVITGLARRRTVA